MLSRSPAILAFRRQQLEAWIETAIALLDAMDGDTEMEDSNDAELEETDENGDEQDCCRSEDEWSPYQEGSLSFDGTGCDIAEGLVRGMPDACRRADAYLALPPRPLIHFY